MVPSSPSATPCSAPSGADDNPPRPGAGPHAGTVQTASRPAAWCHHGAPPGTELAGTGLVIVPPFMQA